jgi:hypothetical protein
MASSAAAPMPVGAPMRLPIRETEITTTEGAGQSPVYTEDAAAVLVWSNYQIAKAFLENNTSWLLEWQEADILYQSPIPNRRVRVEEGRPTRVPRFLVSKFTRTLARAVKRGLFAEQVPFMLRPQGKTTQAQADAWTALLTILLRRMKFQYHGGLQINCQTLQGTGVGKFGWDERSVTKRTRRRKKVPEQIEMPTGTKEVPTKESDEFEEHIETVKESWPFYEYRRLGTTLFDPKWCTPDEPGESAGYCIDIDYVTFADLQRMRQLSCYQKTKTSPGIPPEEDLKAYFFAKQQGSAPTGSQTEDSMSAQGSVVTHAEGRNRQTDASPLEQPLLLLEQWDAETVKTILCYEGRKLTIRNEEHYQGSMSHTSVTWWPIDNSGYGMGIGKINGPDQRINQGVINECLKMIAYPMNAPILVARGDNAPTQNVISRHGGFWQVDTGPSGDVNKAVGFMKAPDVPADAWRFVDLSQRGGEELSGAEPQMQQGNLTSKQGAARSATGAARVAAMSDQNVADPVDSFANGAIIPTVEFLIHMVKTKMPLQEIRKLLSAKHATVIQAAIEQEQFLASEFEVAVLAGQKLAAKQGIQQLIPFFLQIVQQPQLLQFLHERGDTVDFVVIMDLLLQVSELAQQPDIFRPLTPRERVMVKQMNQGAQRLQAQAAVENLKGQNRVREIKTKGEVDLGNRAAEIAMERIGEGIPLVRATGLVTRGNDEDVLRHGLPDVMHE